MRLFVGIPLAPDLITEASVLTQLLQLHSDGLRWMPPESWHITLDFLGTTRQEQYGCIGAGLRELHHAPVSIELGEWDFFDRAGVFILGVKLTPELAILQKMVTTVSAQCQFLPEDRPYRPHVTLARTKARGGSLLGMKTKSLQQPNLRTFTAESFALYESFLGPNGSQYKIRESFPLAALHPGKGLSSR